MRKRARKAKGPLKKERVIGLIDSPFVKGLVSLIPVLILLVMGGLVFFGTKYEELRLVRSNPESALAHFRLAETAAEQGDYNLAEEEYFRGLALSEGDSSRVLGVGTQIEDIIWPERKIRREIESLEAIVGQIESREVNMRLAILYKQLGEEIKASEYWNRAFEIDPNDEQLRVLED